jgi:signal transduction histidine kinase
MRLERGWLVRLKVEDTGVGIPAAELPKMFQRFHRVQNVGGSNVRRNRDWAIVSK